MTEPSPLLVVRGLSKRFSSFQALHLVQFSVRPGEVLGLIGPNGSGKTTLFECVAGVMPADSGSVSSGGVSLGAESRKDVLYFMPDGIRPWPDQTVAWALEFVGGLYGVTAARRAEIVAALDIGHLLGSHMGELSKGEHKRALLALGLSASQPLLMLDEPFDGLDARQTRDVMGVLRAETRRGRTLFLSIHQLGDAARICDRFVLLNAGRTVGEGTLDELRASVDVAEQSKATLEEVFLALT
ncbi:MAG: transporter related [Gemmatimonadetes bacterium]|nr:transporter related [Gemmatimonadota bacterium]